MGLDYLTKLNSRDFLYENYDNMLKSGESLSLILFDFTKLKYINDNYGYLQGDACLALFGKLVRKFFPNDLICRIGGDEFTVVTALTKEEIEATINAFYADIPNYYDPDPTRSLIPSIFSFNCGIVDAEDNLANTMEKADKMVKYAKLNNIKFLFFDQKVYDRAKTHENFRKNIATSIETGDIQFEEQFIYGDDEIIKELYSRDSQGNSILAGNNYALLSHYLLLKKLDLLNLKRVTALPKQSNKLLLNINCQTIEAREFESFPKYVADELKYSKFNPEDLILAINRSGSTMTIDELACNIYNLKTLGINICMDSHSNNEEPLCTTICTQAPVDYIKLSRRYWRHGNESERELLKTNIPWFDRRGIKLMFSSVETKEENDYIKRLCPKAMVKGYYYDSQK